jgi:hypothetical protein
MQLDEAPLKPLHEPVVHRRTDGFWEVTCVGCRLDATCEIPIGIGLPLRSRATAERLLQNHAYATVGAA